MEKTPADKTLHFRAQESHLVVIDRDSHTLNPLVNRVPFLWLLLMCYHVKVIVVKKKKKSSVRTSNIPSIVVLH